jgi:hypothetical protein
VSNCPPYQTTFERVERTSTLNPSPSYLELHPHLEPQPHTFELPNYNYPHTSNYIITLEKHPRTTSLSNHLTQTTSHVLTHPHTLENTPQNRPE